MSNLGIYKLWLTHLNPNRSGQNKSGGGSRGSKRKYLGGGYEPGAKRARQSYQNRWRTSEVQFIHSHFPASTVGRVAATLGRAAAAAEAIARRRAASPRRKMVS